MSNLPTWQERAKGLKEQKQKAQERWDGQAGDQSQKETQQDPDEWPDGWGRAGRHPTFALQLICQQPNGWTSKAVLYGSIASEIVMEHAAGQDKIAFFYETHEGLFLVTITGKDMSSAYEWEGRKFNSIYDQVCEAKRLSIRQNAPHVASIDILGPMKDEEEEEG